MTSDAPPFTQVDDEAFDRGRGFGRTLGPLVGVTAAYLLLFGGVAYAYWQDLEGLPLPSGGTISLLNWMTLLSLVVVAAVVLLAVAGSSGRATDHVRALVEDRPAAVAFGVLVGLVAIAVVGPLVHGRPTVDPGVAYQPPVGTAVADYVPVSCMERAGAERCRGTLAYPLGTDEAGRDVLVTTVYGLGTSLRVGVAAAVISGGFGTAVGLVAGTTDGHVDTVLMRYVDVQSAVPAFFAYVTIVAIAGADLVLMVLVFGLLSWGGTARVVRSEVLRVQNAPYIRVSRAVGAGRLHRLRYHVLPNVGHSVVVPLTTLVPMYVLYEAALSFLGFGNATAGRYSLGAAIAAGLDSRFFGWWNVWWQPVVPAVVVTLLVLSMLVVGDRTRDVVDPRGT